jgi:hypothetical protein
MYHCIISARTKAAQPNSTLTDASMCCTVWGRYLLTAYLAVLAVDAAWAALQLARPKLNPAWADANLTEAQVVQRMPSNIDTGHDIMHPTYLAAPHASPSLNVNCIVQANLWGIPATSMSPAAKRTGQQPQRQAPGQQPQQQQQGQQHSHLVTPLVSLHVHLCKPHERQDCQQLKGLVLPMRHDTVCDAA